MNYVQWLILDKLSLDLSNAHDANNHYFFDFPWSDILR